jgi:hypothetical protein
MPPCVGSAAKSAVHPNVGKFTLQITNPRPSAGSGPDPLVFAGWLSKLFSSGIYQITKRFHRFFQFPKCIRYWRQSILNATFF